MKLRDFNKKPNPSKAPRSQKIVLNNDDKVLVYGSAATLDVVASILEDVT